MLRIDVLPAGHGDCLWIEYGSEPDVHRVLIDGGVQATADDILTRINSQHDNAHTFELGIVTHVDADHITGILKLFEQDSISHHFRDIWFNAWKHLLPDEIEEEGPVQGEKLSAILKQAHWPWNRAFNGRRVAVPKDGPLPVVTLTGGLKLTLLSPRPSELHRLQTTWAKEVNKAGLEPGFGVEEPEEEPVRPGLESFGETMPDIEALATTPYTGDGSRANGSSIAVLAEYQGSRMLLAGDAHADVLLESLTRLPDYEDPTTRIPIDLFKLSHHGSRANINQALLDRLDCQRYVFSTNGSYFRHPDPEAVAKVIKYGSRNSELCFNFHNKHTRVWNDDLLKLQYQYTCRYPENKGEALRIVLKGD